VRYFNPGAPAAWPGNAGAVNRTVIVSFKLNPSDILSGAEDSRMKTWFANAPRDRDVYWSYYHEPEDQIADGDFSAADYRSAWRHLKSLANQAHNPRLYSTLILMQWTLNPQANRNWQDIGMDVPAELREGEDPAKHLRLREETYSMPLNRGVGA